jgi:putative sugar O-methyltransferase
MSSDDVLGTPSRFWQELGAEHARTLDTFGFDEVKRRQALRYFNWRWHWSTLRESVQIRFLAAHSSPQTWLRCAMSPADLSDAAWTGVPWSRSDRWLYVLAVRLVWEYALRQGNRQVLELAEPVLGSPLPVHWRKRLISQDLANGALEAGAIEEALAGRIPQSIMEIGAGYGRTAYTLLNLYPQATYTIVDVEPAISISRWYLTSLFPVERLRFLSPVEATGVLPASVDLAVSISSLHEMTLPQVSGYLDLLDSVARGGVAYFKQWERWRNPADEVTMVFDRYPIPPRWRLLFRRNAPVQTNFREAAWAIR